MTKTILERLNRRGDLTISGFAWQKGSIPRELAPNDLAARVLCRRHNSALGRLDAAALRLFDAIDRMDLLLNDKSARPEHRVHLFNGHDLERWMLKVLCGLVASGNVEGRPSLTSSEIPKEWTELLFSQRSFDTGQGLYLIKTVGKALNKERGLRLRIVLRRGLVSGLCMEMDSYEFRLILDPEIADKQVFLGDVHAYRPLELHVSNGPSATSLLMVWDGPAQNGTIHVSVPESYSPDTLVLMTTPASSIGFAQSILGVHPMDPPASADVHSGML